MHSGQMVNKSRVFPPSFPRQFRSRILFNKEDLEEEIKKWHGVGQCYISLYGFRRFSIKPDWKTAEIDRVLIECDYDTLKQLLQFVKDNADTLKSLHIVGYTIWYIGKGQFYFMLLTDRLLYTDELSVIIEKLTRMLNKADIHAIINKTIDKKILMIGTLNMIANRYVISINSEDVKKGLKHIDSLAKPRSG